uniref:recombinase family protein n=1 Tax=uncultured Allobaculum sp. TaxID=1187017 RepID=UPI0026EC1FC8
GISGTTTKKRPQFNRMIALALQGKIDLILAKSIQRFARNTVDLLATVRQLKEPNVEVFVEKENLSTFSHDGELMLSIMASFA